MSELTDTLEKVIQQAALDGALTKDAVSQFHSLVVERNALKDANVEWEETDKKSKQEHVTLNASFSQVSSQLSDYQTRERELVERETKVTRLEIEKECSDKRVEDHVKMVELVFRNLEVRRNVFPVQPSTHINDQGMHGSGGMVEERLQTEKTE